MGKYIVLFRMPPGAMEEAMKNMTPENMKNAMEPWMAWVKKCGEHLVDMGSPIIGGRNIAPTGVSPTDGTITGYSMLEADDLDQATALLDGHPHLIWYEGAEVQVYECVPMPMPE